MPNLSVALATYNEEENIRDCLASVQGLADEMIVVDGESQDQTAEIAKFFGAKVVITNNPPIFHINKQKALDLTTSDWILQLDADERVGPKLFQEIKQIINMSEEELEKYQSSLKNKRLFLRHQQIIEQRDGKVGENGGEYVAFFIPRLNFFLGKYLKHGGVYPDGVIRLVKKNKAYFPCKDVHEQMKVLGKVGWLENDLLHLADPNLKRYLKRNNNYINLMVNELKQKKVGKNPWQFINFVFIKSSWWFLLTQIRHRGILDGLQGIIFSFFSALRFPRAYLRYLIK